MRALNTIGPRRPRIAFATSRKGPQARLLAYTPRNPISHQHPMLSPGCWTYMPCLDSPTQFGYYPAPFHKRSSDDVPTMSGLNGFHHLGRSREFPPWGADPGLAMPPLWGNRR